MENKKKFGKPNSFSERAESIIIQFEKNVYKDDVIANKNEIYKKKNDIFINRLLYSSLSLAVLLFVFMIYDTFFYI
ncbi:MAG: hypothetical protein ACK5LY_02430 [Lachnospirales bacterium]